MLIVIAGWASWSVSDPGQYPGASNMIEGDANTNAGTVGYILMHAMRRIASEVGDTHHKGQIAKHGFLVE